MPPTWLPLTSPSYPQYPITFTLFYIVLSGVDWNLSFRLMILLDEKSRSLVMLAYRIVSLAFFTNFIE